MRKMLHSAVLIRDKKVKAVIALEGYEYSKCYDILASIAKCTMCIGTGGTFMGCAKRLKEFDPSVKTAAVTPESPFHGIEGIKHYSAVTAEGFYDSSYEDERIEVTTEEAYFHTKRLTKQEGLLVGISSGANAAAALKLAETAPPNSVIVTILCDAGDRYLSGNVWNDQKGEL